MRGMPLVNTHSVEMTLQSNLALLFVNNLYLLALTHNYCARHSMFTFPLIRAQMNSSSDTLPVQGTMHSACLV